MESAFPENGPERRLMGHDRGNIAGPGCGSGGQQLDSEGADDEHAEEACRDSQGLNLCAPGLGGGGHDCDP